MTHLVQLSEWQKLAECPVKLVQASSEHSLLSKVSVGLDGLPEIKTRVVLKNPLARLPLTFKPSLNYLVVVGGGNNSRWHDYLNEYEFQNNALNHLWWWFSADENQYTKFGLNQNCREFFFSGFEKLMQSHMIDQIFNTCDKGAPHSTLAKNNAEFLFAELNKSGSLLLHANDQNHAFYIQIDALSCEVVLQYNLHVYNTGKGIGSHDKELVCVKGKIKTKYHTRKSFFDINFSSEKLQTIIASMDCQARRYWRPARSIYILYSLFSQWQKSEGSMQSVLPPKILQTKQKHHDCQNESLLAVLRHILPLKAYKVFKLTLLQRAFFLSIPPIEFTYSNSFWIKWYYQNVYQKAINRLKEKISRTHFRITNLTD